MGEAEKADVVFPDPPLRVHWHPAADRESDAAFIARVQEWAWFAEKLKELGRFPPSAKIARTISVDLGIKATTFRTESFFSVDLDIPVRGTARVRAVTVYFCLIGGKIVWVVHSHATPGLLVIPRSERTTFALVARRCREVKGHLQDQEYRS